MSTFQLQSSCFTLIFFLLHSVMSLSGLTGWKISFENRFGSVWSACTRLCSHSRGRHTSNAHAPTHFRTPVISGMPVFSLVALRRAPAHTHVHTHIQTQGQWVSTMWVAVMNVSLTLSILKRPAHVSAESCPLLSLERVTESANVCLWVYLGLDLTSITSLQCHKLTDTGYTSVFKRDRKKLCQRYRDKG